MYRLSSTALSDGRLKSAVVYIHGKGGNIREAEHYAPLFPDCDILGFDYTATVPWEAKEEFPAFVDVISRKYDEITLVANSIGAYFAMVSLNNSRISRAFFISPVVDMEKLILSMLGWADVSEAELRERGEIFTGFGEMLSWNYLCHVRNNPISWNVPTHILYGENDDLTDEETIKSFSDSIGATLTVMKNGEHWFHTPEQMDFLDSWIKSKVPQ